MANISVANTNSQLSGKTLVVAENDTTITGALTFDRDPSAPFIVVSGSAVVTNLDADKVDGYEAAALAVLAENETISGDWTFSSAPTLSEGIKFPSSANPQADSNNLDDYQENIWTPDFTGTGGSETYTNQAGRYTKVGRQISFTGRLRINDPGTLSGNITITGLPENAGAGDDSASVHFGVWANMNSNILNLSGLISGTTITVYKASAAAASVSQLQGSDLKATTDVYFSGHYFV